MSALLFPHARGTVKRVRGPSRRVAGFSVNVQGWDNRQRAIFTGGAVVQNGNFQFLHTLNDQIFIYVFGDRISEVILTGLSFGTYAGSGAGCAPSQPGTMDVFPFYQQNRLSVRGAPLLIRMGRNGVFRGFLSGMNFNVLDPETMLGQFSFRFHSFPT